MAEHADGLSASRQATELRQRRSTATPEASAQRGQEGEEGEPIAATPPEAASPNYHGHTGGFAGSNAGMLPQSSFRWVLSSLTVLLVIVISILYAMQHIERRRRREDTATASSVPQLLDAAAVHHVDLAVSNLTRSWQFYSSVLGGRDTSLAATNWRMVSFGPTQLLLWQASPQILEARRAAWQGRPQLVLRMGHTTDPADLINSVHKQLLAWPALLGAVECSMENSDNIEVPGTFLPQGWLVVACSGPDGEALQFWRPSLDTVQRLERARGDWAASASDPRGRDLFE